MNSHNCRDVEDSPKETSQNKTIGRRQLLKAIAATGGAVAASNALPGKWIKPIIEVGLLPAHAQTSPTATPPASAPDPDPITPEIVGTLCVGETLAATVTTFIPPIPGKADILFAFDTTGSMGGVLNQAKAEAQNILNELSTLVSNLRVGVADFRDYPLSGFEDSDDQPRPLGFGDYPYQLRQAMTSNETLVRSAINSLSPGGGGDGPESYTRTLYESYSDTGLGFRSDAKKFVVMFGDNVPHDNDLNEGVPSPPFNPGEIYCNDNPCTLDPGRDNVLGTADDLDLQSVLAEMRTNQVTLLHAHRLNDSFLVYWDHWAGLTGAGGQAVSLSEASNLTSVIVSLVSDAGREIETLTLDVTPDTFASWMTTADSQSDLTIPADGLSVNLDLTLSPPTDTPANVYNFIVRTVGDGFVYRETPTEVTVPTTCEDAEGA